MQTPVEIMTPWLLQVRAVGAPSVNHPNEAASDANDVRALAPVKPDRDES